VDFSLTAFEMNLRLCPSSLRCVVLVYQFHLLSETTIGLGNTVVKNIFIVSVSNLIILSY